MITPEIIVCCLLKTKRYKYKFKVGLFAQYALFLERGAIIESF